MILTIELVPITSWYSNLRSELTKSEWDKLRKATYEKAGNVCEICGGVGPKWPVECHEVWDYDKDNNIQTLVRLEALCPSCHSCKHIGLAQIKGNYKEAKAHLAEVNGITLDKAEEYINTCFGIWEQRNLIKWELDLSWLDHN